MSRQTQIPISGSISIAEHPIGPTGAAHSSIIFDAGFLKRMAWKIIAVLCLATVSACSFYYKLQKPVDIHGNCDPEAVTAALDGRWHAQNLRFSEIYGMPPPNQTHAGLHEKRMMEKLLSDFLKKLDDHKQCYSKAFYTLVPSEKDYSLLYGHVEFFIHQDQSVCVGNFKGGEKYYCSQNTKGGNK